MWARFVVLLGAYDMLLFHWSVCVLVSLGGCDLFIHYLGMMCCFIMWVCDVVSLCACVVVVLLGGYDVLLCCCFPVLVLWFS